MPRCSKQIGHKFKYVRKQYPSDISTYLATPSSSTTITTATAKNATFTAATAT
ncbi:hypothetical protein AtNW77_Chr2g0250911 [Arabidopsis thaliana]|uniref:At2g30985 n=4 Tax=Arabidopsis TaxID=3701 RepID=Q3EBR2_ARATH|nr:uncharacterized protein AT2G30985 [Arabidopsis thaliana]KAG7638037.1 hypothetical protein ISN45_At02g025190 [Arabidopsis thaliana x Arabidopsis arenosa]KAG7642661.1 hypothetical protein ISN44_As02g025510 [Arabidopsis suecica]ABJ17132.1 At2g30985 [Arabidopsis thaliana]AEC08471.1 hypothetical protein AT2G30985 [Arabidopsis thaliana]CAA0373745.1 unnamed protein product [Arabidopsis thaliana]|eukprot:NP_973573.1 hypothetical protein AT2G30985 [Arabidopsis thaliana]